MQLNKILIPNQFAFKKLHSTITSLINVSDYWYENINEKKVNIALFLDLKKAFDMVDHEILISKLDSYGVQGDAKKWFVSYLNNRYQYCSLDGCRSTAKMITCGIPQGSCLGPLLFIIYLNDFTSCLQFSKANLYADDTETTISSSDIGDLTRSFQTELDNISDWMRVNKLSINPDKTEFMVIGNPRRTNKFADLSPFFLGKNEISRVDKTKYLGVMVDDKLNWGNQFRSVKGKITSGLASLKMLKNIIPQSQLMHVYYALIESHLRYANVVWGSLSDTKNGSTSTATKQSL